ncbi:MAG: hypothetical protein ABH889_02565 [Candidatus Portnoybacteria bacterium]
MTNIVFYILIILSLAGLGFIIYRKIPILANLSDEEIMILSRKRGVVEKVREINYKQHWFNFIIVLQKLLMRLRIVFLKSESVLGKWIGGLRGNSRIMAQRSKEWIKQRETRRQEKRSKLNGKLNGKNGKENEEVILTIKREKPAPIVEEKKEDEITLDDLNKPIKEEQKWIDLIVENPKNITAYKFLGLFYYKQHNHPDAKSSLEMAVKLGSKDKKVKEILEELKGVEIE